MARFQDRTEAGRFLATKLLKYSGRKPVVLALPRGGVPVAAEIARELGAPMDLLIVKKIGAPGQPEFAVGAVSEDQAPEFNDEVIERYGLDRDKISETAKIKMAEVRQQIQNLRGGLPKISVENRTVILVDDGLATGATMMAAIRSLRERRPKEIVVAVPVASKEAFRLLHEEVIETVSLMTPDPFYSVGSWYRDFEQVSDDEVKTIFKSGSQIGEPQIEINHVSIPADRKILEGDLAFVPNAKAAVIFAHGSGSSRLSPRNQFVAKALNRAGFTTLLFDLLTDEESVDKRNVFDIELLGRRLLDATNWVQEHYPDLPIAYFGASTGSAAALGAAAERPKGLYAVVSRGGRPDLAQESFERVQVPTLLLVGGDDREVIQLNSLADDHLKISRLVIIPGAGHLFEEPGKLEEVIEYSLDWLLKHLPSSAEAMLIEPKEAIVREIERLARPLASETDFEALAQQLSSRRIVMLGEASHGTQEFYDIRRKLSQVLIEKHGFNFIAVEGDWPDCHRLNLYARSGRGGTAREVLRKFERWPAWMWANDEILRLAEWMRKHRAGFYGLDVYSLFESIEVIKKYAKRLNIEVSERVLERYACFERFGRDEISYAKSLISFAPGCEQEVIDNLRELVELRLKDIALTEAELFDVHQNARVVMNAESYYRAMLTGGPDSWNIRDQHMLDTLEALLRKEGPESKAIVWAHNTHIGDYHATDMIDGGQVNLGGLAREHFGQENVALVGFGTYEGTVLAGRTWGAPEQIMRLPRAPAGTYEAYFHKACEEIEMDQIYLTFDERSKHGGLARVLGHRAVGVVYSSANERGNYVPTNLSHRYDSFVFLDQTTALHSMKKLYPSHGRIPETWPSGQ